MTLKISPNSLIGKQYDKDTYHCYHFIEECLNVPKLDDVAVDTVINDIEKYRELFSEIIFPIDYCIALLGDKHIGIYHDGGVYHNDTQGVRYQSLRVMKMQYKTIRYYMPKGEVCSL